MKASERGLLLDLRRIDESSRTKGQPYLCDNASRMFAVCRTLEALGYADQVGAPIAPPRIGTPYTRWILSEAGHDLLSQLERSAALAERHRRLI